MKRLKLKDKRPLSDQTTILNYLRIQWRIVCFGSLCFVLVCFSVLHYAWQPGYAWQWLLQTVAILAYVLGMLRSCLSNNHRKDDIVLLPTLGVGTLMTIYRGVLISMLAGFLFLPWSELPSKRSWLHWLPGVFYMLAAVADYADGYLARITNHETRLGEIFDTKMDALGLLIATLLTISFGRLPIYYIAVGVAYYILSFGIWVRKKSGKPLIELQPYPQARILAGFQMGLVSIALFPVFSPTVTSIAAIIFMTPFLIGFVRDWLVVCGRIRQDSVQWNYRKQIIHVCFTKYLPLCLRVLMLWAGWVILQDWRVYFSPEMEIIPNPIPGIAEAKFYIWNSMNIAVFIMIIFGIMGRVAVLLLSFLTGLMITCYGALEPLVIMYSCSLVLMLIGTGALSVWQPEDSLLFRRAGERG